MSDSAESIRRGARYLILVLVVAGIAAVVAATLWWVHTLVQEGLTPEDLGTIGMICIVGAALLFMLFGMTDKNGTTIFEAITGAKSDD